MSNSESKVEIPVNAAKTDRRTTSSSSSIASSSSDGRFEKTTDNDSGRRAMSGAAHGCPPSRTSSSSRGGARGAGGGTAGREGLCLQVHPRQQGNRLLPFIKNIPWRFDPSLVPDFLLGDTAAALFLSLQYHRLHPGHLAGRFSQVRHHFEVRVLLVLVDVQDPEPTLQELTLLTIQHKWVIICCWSYKEAARYLETYKSFEKTAPGLIAGPQTKPGDHKEAFAHTLGLVKSVNKTDISTLASTFGTVAALSEASEEDLMGCPGFGPKKAKRLYQSLHGPFVTSNVHRK